MAEVSSEAAQRLMQGTLLSGMEAGERQALLDHLAEQRGKAGEILLTQGQPNDHLSFLIEGRVAVERKRADGRTEAIATLQAPAIFGVTSFFGPRPPSFSVRALGDVWMLTLFHPSHERLRVESPRAAEALALAALRNLAEHFDELDRIFSDYIATHPADHPKVTEWAGFRARMFEGPTA